VGTAALELAGNTAAVGFAQNTLPAGRPVMTWLADVNYIHPTCCLTSLSYHVRHRISHPAHCEARPLVMRPRAPCPPRRGRLLCLWASFNDRLARPDKRHGCLIAPRDERLGSRGRPRVDPERATSSIARAQDCAVGVGIVRKADVWRIVRIADIATSHLIAVRNADSGLFGR
jgi:hypothetical protein